MTMQNNNNDKGLKLELDTSTDLPSDDAAFDDGAIDEELDDSMTTALPQQRNSRGKAKLMAGVVLVALLGVGGYVGYTKMSGGSAPTAAIPGDVPAGQPIERVSGDGSMPAPADGAVAMDPMGNPLPADPMMAGAMPPADGSMPAPMPMDGGMPIDPAMDPNAAGIAPPPAPGMPDAVMADGTMPPVDPMMAGQPIDGGMPMDGGAMPPADPMADPMAGITMPADPAQQPMADGSMPAPMPMDGGMAPQPNVAGIVPPPATPPAAPVVETVVQTPPAGEPAPAPVVTAPVAPAVDPAVAQEMRSKIESLESRIAEMDRELKTLRQQQGEAKPAAASSEVTAADLKALERRIDALATKAASTAAAPAAAKAAPTPLVAPKPVAPAPVATPEVRNTTMVAPATSTVRTAVGTATGEPVISPQTPRAPVASAPAPTAGKVVQWQLRSAQPGRATLSQQGSQEMRNVGVGDEVPGLGRILSIAQGADGRWVVRGSMGSAAQ